MERPMVIAENNEIEKPNNVRIIAIGAMIIVSVLAIFGYFLVKSRLAMQDVMSQNQMLRVQVPESKGLPLNLAFSKMTENRSMAIALSKELRERYGADKVQIIDAIGSGHTYVIMNKTPKLVANLEANGMKTTSSGDTIVIDFSTIKNNK